MILKIIITVLALIGAVTLVVIALTLWAYYSDEEAVCETPPFIDVMKMAYEDNNRTIQTADIPSNNGKEEEK